MNISNSISFKELARRHQIKFREDVLKVGFNGLETILKDEDAQQGLISGVRQGSAEQVYGRRNY